MKKLASVCVLISLIISFADGKKNKAKKIFNELTIIYGVVG
ncbi:hypothetical protein SAMN04488542_109116 [Fontibacillus panacisegetis]|uniref:Uncharacterized protein n=1 Tax=Fontibacillus panacisegetis TaxID=670482 RepID=A0A1G7KED1_9BACL|nr:hypothetical protein SAMN04488542_109116 [Fontibacillus panacisegetis]